ncbi:unnamed protein product [Miscanthus lutarioriparius]|uniref:glutathione-disulfide reductase n=1 Tax=Miscanthus lutarioriparius TaxID=422564 RepID=A0A811MG82_9POAL|nr:unnamed protein product [Miscanthus lutarioriparius]
MAAATLPSASAKVAVRNLARVASSRQPLLLLHASYRRGRGLHPLPLAASAASQGAHLRRALSVSASATAGGNNDAAPRAAEREYDYDLFTIGAGSGGMRASRVASALYGARAAVCEMPFATVASDALGGVGGTVDGKLYTAENILVAVGGRPSKPNIPGIEHVIDSDAALDLPSRPEKIAIVGGGYIALEFAGVFNGLKSDVHVFIRQKKVLRGFDEEVRDFVAEQMSLRGVKFHIEQSPEAVTKSDDGLLSLKTNKETVSGFSHVMFATGRKPNTKNLGLENVGVKMDEHGAIVVDEYSRTSVDSIWAVGDVTNRLNLTPVALMEAGAIARTIFGNEPTRADYSAVPSAVFSQPPIGHVGLTEDEATETYGDIDIYISNFKPLSLTLSGLPDFNSLWMYINIHGIVIAVKAGLTKQNFDSTIGVHPTTAEEFVTMRNPTRKVRRDTTAEAKTKDEAASQK